MEIGKGEDDEFGRHVNFERHISHLSMDIKGAAAQISLGGKFGVISK